jgi:hypothetical protein
MAAYSLLAMTQMCLARMEKKTISAVANPTDESRFITNALTAAHQWICGIHGWDWLRKEAEVVLVADVDPGTVTVGTPPPAFTTSGSMGASFATYSGGYMKIANAGSADVLRLGTVTGTNGGAFAITNPHTGPHTTCLVVQDTYALPSDFDRPLSTGSFIAAPWQMTAYDPERFLKLRGSDLLTTFVTVGQPDAYTIWGNGDGAQKLIVWPFPDYAQTLSIRYTKKAAAFTADADIPDIPEKYQNVLIYRALDLFYRDKELDMTKRTMFHSMFQNTLQSMLGTVERTSDRMAMQPNTSRQAYSA